MKESVLSSTLCIIGFYILAGIIGYFALNDISNDALQIVVFMVIFSSIALALSIAILIKLPEKKWIANGCYFLSIVLWAPLSLATVVFYKKIVKNLASEETKQVSKNETVSKDTKLVMETEIVSEGIKRAKPLQLFVLAFVTFLGFLYFTVDNIPHSMSIAIVCFLIFAFKNVYVIKENQLYLASFMEDLLIDSSSVHVLEISHDNVTFKQKNKNGKLMLGKITLKSSCLSLEDRKKLIPFFEKILETQDSLDVSE